MFVSDLMAEGRANGYPPNGDHIGRMEQQGRCLCARALLYI